MTAKSENEKIYVPAFDENNVAIVLASSEYYAPYMAVTIQSIINHANSENGYDFLLLYKDINNDVKKDICKMAEGYSNISIRFCQIPDKYSNSQFNFRKDVAAAAESFYCVLLQDIFPAYDKVLCLDCDVVAVQDIAELYNVDISGYMIAATRDPDGIGQCYASAAGKTISPKMKGRDRYMLDTMGLKKIEDYFQSGVMLLNLAEWRKRYTVADILEIATADWIVWGDQDTMNVLCRNNVKYLNLKWNLIINHDGKQLSALLKAGPYWLLDEYIEARETPSIVHYAGTKPWNIVTCDMFAYFWPTVTQTPFAQEIYKRTKEADDARIKACAKDKMLGVQKVEEMYRNGEIGLRKIIVFIKAWIRYKLCGRG